MAAARVPQWAEVPVVAGGCIAGNNGSSEGRGVGVEGGGVPELVSPVEERLVAASTRGPASSTQHRRGSQTRGGLQELQ